MESPLPDPGRGGDGRGAPALNTMNPELIGDIEKLVGDIDPRSILLIAEAGDGLPDTGNRIARRLGAEAALETLAETGYHDLAVFIDDNESLSRPQKEPLISGLRDIHSRRFLLATPENASGQNAHWDHSALIAFGLTELHRYDDGWRLFEYNILNYKKTPDWLNPKNWANPEMWDKYRW